jgi:hypothetical protein
MNLIITNYGHFRLTDYGKGKSSSSDSGRYSLYNRRNGVVMELNKSEHDYIRNSQSQMMACIEVERWYDRKKGKAFDVA